MAQISVKISKKVLTKLRMKCIMETCSSGLLRLCRAGDAPVRVLFALRLAFAAVRNSRFSGVLPLAFRAPVPLPGGAFAVYNCGGRHALIKKRREKS